MRVFSILFLLVLHISCNKVLTKAYGLTEPKVLTRDELILKSKALAITREEAYYLSKDYFYSLLKKDTMTHLNGLKYSAMISKYIQPLQLLYFDSKGNLRSFHNNCNVKGFPLLKWNADHNFDTFLPRTTIPITDSIVTLQFLLNHLKSLESQIKPVDTKWTVVVFWCDFMEKQSKELISVARRNIEKSIEPTRIYYVNVDNCYVGDQFKSAPIIN